MNNKLETIVNKLGVIIGLILLFAVIIALSSCGLTNNLSAEEQQRRRTIDYEATKLWNEYTSKHDSLMIEYYKKDKK